MVGVKKWEDEQIALILACKAEGKKVPEIISELQKRWPRKKARDSGVRYVMNNYKEITETQTQTLAAGSKPQGSSGRASQKRAHPKETKQAKSTERAVPKNINLLTRPSQSPHSLQIDYAARRRQISGGPLEATFTAPQPFKVLKDRVQSTMRLLAHGRQARDIEINAIEFGTEVPAAPVGESIMAFPAPYRRAADSEANAMTIGGYGQHDLQSAVSMPPMYGTSNQSAAMGQQDMRTISHQNPQMGSMNIAPLRQPGMRGHNSQFRGNGQHMGLYQGHFVEMGLNMDANPGVNMGMNIGPPFEINPFGPQMPPPATPQRAYHQGSLNYEPVGAIGGMTSGIVHFGQLYPGQFANPLNNGQYRPAASPMQPTNPELVRIDPSLDPRLFNNTIVSMQQAPIAMGVAGRSPSRSGLPATPQPNHVPQWMAQESEDVPTSTPRIDCTANAVTQENLSGTSATTQPSSPTTSNPGETQNGTTALRRPNRPASAAVQSSQNPQNITTATPLLHRSAISAVQQAQDGTSAPETNNATRIVTAPRTGKVVITLENPRFDEPFSFPSSTEGWSLFLNEYAENVDKAHPAPDKSFTKVSNGDFEVRFINPTFHKGVSWDSAQQALSESIDQIKSPSLDFKMDLDTPTASNQSEGLALSQNLGHSAQMDQLAKPPITSKSPTVAEPSHRKPTPEPDTPSMRVPLSRAVEKTPSMSPLRLTDPETRSPEAIRRPIPRRPIGARKSILVTQGMTKPSPQLSESHSKKPHSPHSGKRTAPTREEISPSKRQKASHHNAQRIDGASVSLPKNGIGYKNPKSMKRPTISGNNSPESYDPFTQISAELRSFAKAVAQLPSLSPSQLLLPTDDKHIRQIQSQRQVPPLSFNPRPSQPINDFDLFQTQSPHRQYSAAMSKLFADRLEKISAQPLINFPNGISMDPDMLPLMHDGLPAQKSEPQQQHNQGADSVANTQQTQPQNEVLAFDFDTNFAANSQYLIEDPEFNFGFDFGDANDNSDLNQILGLDMNMNSNSASSPLLVNANAKPNSNSNSKPNSNQTSSSPGTSPQPPLSPSLAYAAYQLGMDEDEVRALGPIPKLPPWMPDDDKGLHGQMLAEYNRTSGDFEDILDLEGFNDPARQKDGMSVNTG